MQEPCNTPMPNRRVATTAASERRRVASAGHLPPRDVITGDVAWLVASFFHSVVPVAKLWHSLHTASLPLAAPFLLAGPVSGTALAALALFRPRRYLRRRTALLAAVRLVRIALGTFFLCKFGDLVGGIPAEEGWLSRALLPFNEAGILLIQGVGLQLPLPVHLAVHGTGLACYLYASGLRCQAECAHPHMSRFYEGVASSGRGWLGRLLPTVVPSRLDWAFEGAGACWLVRAWALWALGFLLPTLLLDWTQSRSVITHPRFHPPAARTALAYPGLFVVGSVVGGVTCTLAPRLAALGAQLARAPPALLAEVWEC